MEISENDARRLEAISCFMNKPTTDIFSKEEIIIAIQSIVGVRILSDEAKKYYRDALEEAFIYRTEKLYGKN